MEWLERYWGREDGFTRWPDIRPAPIDGPCHYTLPPYNRYVVLGPENPEKVASELSEMLEGTPVLIVDINDLGGTILGSSLGEETEAYYLQFLKDNPLGQSKEQTPMGIIRELE